MNSFKFAFIICGNWQLEIEEALYYISNLAIPEGYGVDVLTVNDATSMAAGYNEAMAASDAKYKIYLHQDVFILNRNLLFDLLDIFGRDPDIGMIGTLGCRMLPQNAHVISRWDTGSVYLNGGAGYMKGYEKKPYAEVMAVDGMFMASQTDIAWREDLFDGWDFYDLSQCCEMLRKGKKIVVPTQEKTWIYHDNKRSALKKFDFYRERFIEEYQDIYPFSKEDGNPFTKQQEYENINDQACRHLAHLIDCGQIDEVCKLFSQPQYKGFLILREIELICAIYSAEKQLYGESVLYGSGDSYSDAYDKLCGLRHSLIKLAVNYEHTKDLPLQIKTCYTPVATALAINAYCYNKSHVCAKLGSLYDAKERFTFQRVTNTLTAAAQNPPVKDSAADTLIIIREYDGKTLKNLINGKDYCADVNCETETVTPAKNRELYQNLFVNPNIVSLVNSLQPYIYTEYDRIIIWGDGMEEYVKLFHNTEIDVTWYIHTPASHTHRFSGNIKILCMTE